MRISSPNTSRRSAELTLFFSSFWKVKLVLSGFPLNLCNKKNQNYILGIFFLFFFFPFKTKRNNFDKQALKSFLFTGKISPDLVHKAHTFFSQKYLFKWYLFQLMDSNLWKSETSNYTFMVWTDSLEVLLTCLQCLGYCSHTVSQRCARKASVDNSSSTTVKKRGWSFSCQWFPSDMDVLHWLHTSLCTLL